MLGAVLRRSVSARGILGRRVVRCMSAATEEEEEAAAGAAGMPPASTTLTEDETFIRDAVRRFAQERIAPVVREMDETHKMDEGMLEDMFQNGLMSVESPPEYGGSGMGFLTACMAVEEISRVDPAMAVVVDIQNTLATNLMRFFASEEQKARYLPRMATDTVVSFCLSEANAGSDAFAMQTRADVSDDGSHYTINGQKLWISNAPYAGLFVVFANANPDAGYKGITCFLVDADTEGIQVAKPERKLGICASATCPVFFDNVRVPAENVLGEVGQGYKYAIGILNEGRIGIGAQMLGLAQGALDHTVPYLLERKQFGQAIYDFQGMNHQVAQAATEVEALRAMVYNTARMKENGQNVVREAAMVKLYSSQVAERVASRCVEWMGGVGYTQDYLAEKFFRDAKIGAIYEGCSLVLKNTIASEVRKDYE